MPVKDSTEPSTTDEVTEMLSCALIVPVSGMGWKKPLHPARLKKMCAVPVIMVLVKIKDAEICLDPSPVNCQLPGRAVVTTTLAVALEFASTDDVATTLKLPVLEGAVYNPELVIDPSPAGTLQVTVWTICPDTCAVNC